MVNGSSQQKKYIHVLFSSSIFYTIFSNALQFEVNNLTPGVERRLGNYQVALGGTKYYNFFILQCICNWKIVIINPPRCNLVCRN